MDPTMVQLYPGNWIHEIDPPCYLVFGNWLDPTTAQFVTDLNIQLVIQVAGHDRDKGSKPPPGGYFTSFAGGCCENRRGATAAFRAT